MTRDSLPFYCAVVVLLYYARYLCANARGLQYLGKENITIEPTIDRNILAFLALIRRKYVSADDNMRSMDLAEKTQFFTLDTIMDIATGVPVGDLEHDSDVYNYLKTTADALAPLIMIGSVPAAANFLRIPFIAQKLYPTAEDKIGFGRLIGYVHTPPTTLTQCRAVS